MIIRADPCESALIASRAPLPSSRGEGGVGGGRLGGGPQAPDERGLVDAGAQAMVCQGAQGVAGVLLQDEVRREGRGTALDSAAPQRSDRGRPRSDQGRPDATGAGAASSPQTRCHAPLDRLCDGARVGAHGCDFRSTMVTQARRLRRHRCSPRLCHGLQGRMVDRSTGAFATPPNELYDLCDFVTIRNLGEALRHPQLLPSTHVMRRRRDTYCSSLHHRCILQCLPSTGAWGVAPGFDVRAPFAT